MASWNPALRPNANPETEVAEPVSQNDSIDELPIHKADDAVTSSSEIPEETQELRWDTQDTEAGQDEPEDEFFVRHGGRLSYDAKANPKANPLISRATGLDEQPEEDTEEEPTTPIDPPENTSTSDLINAPPVADTSPVETRSVVQRSADENYELQSESTFLEDAKQENPADPLVTEDGAELDWGASDDTFDIGRGEQPVLLAQPVETAAEKNLDWGEATDDFDLGVKFAPAMATETAPAPSLKPKPAELDWGEIDDGEFSFEATNAQGGDGLGPETQQEDLDDMWKAALDDDFGTTADSSAFLFDDDEGFLEEEETSQTAEQTAPNGTNGAINGSLSNSRYAPVGAQAVQPAVNQYAPQSGQFTDFSQLNKRSNPQVSTPAYGGMGVQSAYGKPERPVITNSAQSFADKNKGGYASPYDLPTDIIQPKKRASTTRMGVPSAQATPPPPRSSSMNSTGSLPPPRSVPTSSYGLTSLSPPSSSSSMKPEIQGQLKPKASSSDFFAELPSVSKPRSSGRYTPQPSAVPHAPQGPLPTSQPPSNLRPSISEPHADPVTMTSHLQQPERLGLFSESPQPANLAPSAPPKTSQRYSPAPGATGPTATRYSPAPPVVAPSQTSTSVPPPTKFSPPLTAVGPSGLNGSRYVAEPSSQPRSSSQSFLPRTSSPLAQHTMSQGGAAARSSSQAPPTAYQPSASTPPPTGLSSSAANSPGRTSNYATQPQSTQAPSQPKFAPPRRSQTSSPGTVMKSPPHLAGNDRPSSHHGPLSPPGTMSGESIFAALPPRPGFSQDTTYVVPSDERAQDPLERWKGYPVFRWGLGGTVVTCFPQQTPRYGAGNSAPTMKRTPGEVKLQSIKQAAPLVDRVASFPGPLKGKGRKKDLLAWLKVQVESMEKDYQSTAFHGATTEELRTRDERLLLWKILQVFIENDGKLEGSKAAEDAVKEVLSAGVKTSAQTAPEETTKVPSEPVDAQVVQAMRSYLSTGDREKATWHAVDNRMWGHAMLISSTLSKDIWKQVIQEFVRQEVRKVGGDNQALAALYEVFAGNWEDSVDQLVPVSARAGFQMMHTSGPAVTKNALEGLDKWQETLLLILGNRSEGDSQALLSLGKLLAGYRRIDAAHICNLFARSIVHFGGSDDSQADVVLFGADQRNAIDIAQDLDAIILTEVYEYGLSLSSTTSGLPHLQPYKLVHAYALAEYGQRSVAISYCDHIAAAVKSSTRGSLYYNATFLSHLDDLTKRLSQAPKDGASSWISKPSMDKVSGSLLAKFNSFVSGDDSDAASNHSGGADVGPFARIAGNTPTISPSQSSADLYGQYRSNGSITSPTSVTSPPGSFTTSRYAPGGAYAPQQALEQPQAQYAPQEPSSYQSSSAPNPYEPSYNSVQAPTSQPPKAQGDYTQVARESSYVYSPFGAGTYQPNPAEGMNAVAEQPMPSTFDQQSTSYNPPTSDAASAYEPPNMGSYEPPSYQPYEPEPEQVAASTGTKKSFMDDDDDGQLFKQAEALKKQQRAQADKEAEENFKRAAEADSSKAKGQDGGKGWFGGWFKKDPNAAPGPIKAKLGEESSFYYDTDLKKWVNKKGGAAAATATAPTPPPPRGPPSRAPSGTGPPTSSGPPSRPPTSVPMPGPPSGPPSRVGTPTSTVSVEGRAPAPSLLAPHLTSNGPPSGPPSRPNTSMSNASSIDDLLGAPQARKGGTIKKPKRGGRYVDVMGAK